MLLLISFMTACTAYLLVMTVVALRTPEKVNVTHRLQKTLGSNDLKDGNFDIREVELQKSFSERALRPLLGKIAGLVKKMLPGTMLANLQPRLNRAGNPGGLGAEEFLALKFIAILITLFLVFTLLLGQGTKVFAFVLLLGGTAGGWFLPEAYLQSQIRQREKEIEQSMPDVLDLLTVCVEAGYSWDGALQKVVQKKKGPLSTEFKRVLQEAKVGKPRKDALRSLTERVNAPCLTTFVAAVIQADQLGLSLGQVLRTQSDQIRQKRRQEIEEEAMKAPIKILFPLVFFIFPAIFIILLGPALMQIMEVL